MLEMKENLCVVQETRPKMSVAHVNVWAVLWLSALLHTHTHTHTHSFHDTHNLCCKVVLYVALNFMVKTFDCCECDLCYIFTILVICLST